MFIDIKLCSILNEDEREKLFLEYTENNNPSCLPLNEIVSKEWYKNPRLYENNYVKLQIQNVKDFGLRLIGDPIFKTKDTSVRDYVIKFIVENFSNIIVSGNFKDEFSKYVPMKEYNRQYYSNVESLYNKHNKNKWLTKKGILRDDPRVTYEDYEYSKHYKQCLELYESWKYRLKKSGYKMYFDKMYNDILKGVYDYKGKVLCYRGVPVMFRFYKVWNGKYCKNEFEVGLGSVVSENKYYKIGKNDNPKYSEYLKNNLDIVLDNKSREIKSIYIENKEKINKLSNSIEIEPNTRKRKKLYCERRLYNLENIEITKDWKKKEFDTFENFIKKYSNNYNRYLFTIFMYNAGISWYYEDGENDAGLKQNKSELNEYSIGYYNWLKGWGYNE